MHEHGIDWAMLSLTAPGVQAIPNADQARAGARTANDFLAEQIAQRPTRYAGFAAVALQHPESAADELRRCVRELGFVGAMVNGYSDIGDQFGYLDEPQFVPFWAAAHELSVSVYLHPRPALPSARRITEGHPELVGATWGFGTETATHTLRLVFSGLFDRFPELQLILGHLGEGLLAMLWRIQYCFELNPFDKKIERNLAEYFADNIHITTSGFPTRH